MWGCGCVCTCAWCVCKKERKRDRDRDRDRDEERKIESEKERERDGNEFPAQSSTWDMILDVNIILFSTTEGKKKSIGLLYFTLTLGVLAAVLVTVISIRHRFNLIPIMRVTTSQRLGFSRVFVFGFGFFLLRS